MTNNLDNIQKAIHGSNTKKALDTVLSYAKQHHWISNIKPIKTPRSITNQFAIYAPHVITLKDESMWAIYTTSSYRTDRVKETYWDCFLLKKYYNEISRCILVFTDSVSEIELQNFKAGQAKLRAIVHPDIPTLDEIMSVDDLFLALEEAAEKYYLAAEKSLGTSTSTAKGTIKDQKGREMEERLAEALNAYQNLEKYQSKPSAVGIYYQNYFEPIVKKIGLDEKKEYIENLLATTNIAKLPSGGSPKTDILLKVTLSTPTRSTESYTFSVKRTSSDYVSAHQYSADAFIDALSIIPDSELASLLELFQEVGGVKALGKENEDRLSLLLVPYLEMLTKWVVSGEGGPSDNYAVAQYIITCSEDGSSIKVHTAQEYCEQLLKDSNGQLGTPFKWTYASGSKGKSIQLKMPILDF